jgi:staphylococcal nuclease domain-containing protein 1
LIEPFGDEAKYFSETRLLQRDVKIILEGTNNNSFVGSVLHPNGDIAEALLGEGLSKIVDWTVAIVTAGPEKLRAAESRAKKNNLRVWKEFVPANNHSRGRKMEFDGVVNRYDSLY